MFKPNRWTARALARIVFGVLLILGAIREVAYVIVSRDVDSSVRETIFAISTRHAAGLAVGLLQTWIVAAIAATAVRVSLRHMRPAARDEDRRRLLVASFVIPAIGIALLLPLSMHALFATGVSGGSSGIDDWLAMGMVFAGLAHVVFAIMLALRAADLARGHVKPLGVGVLYFATVLAGSLPFPIIPSVFIAITGLPLLPLLYAMKPYIERERLAAAEPALPEAVVRHALHAA